MNSTTLLHELIESTCERHAHQVALSHANGSLDYGTLAERVSAFASGLASLDLARSERVAIFLDKRPEVIIAAFGASRAGGVFVPINPLLKPEQVSYILRD